MCIYCGTANYRKIYETHYGPIPVDSDGRTYEIHHIDGDHSNNNPDNLSAVSIVEHFNIHYSQKDWNACLIMSNRMKLSVDEKSLLAQQNNHHRLSLGLHHFTDSDWQRENQFNRVNRGTHPFKGGTIQRRTAQKLIEEGTHVFMKKPDGSSLSKERVSRGTHNFCGGEETRKQLLSGKHSSQIKVKCPHCNKIGGKAGMMTRHFNKCKFRKS